MKPVLAPPPSKPQAVPAPSKMRLDSLVRGRLDQPRRICVYGPEGCGKSTFASDSPSPVFIGAEDGTAQLDVTRFPTPDSWADVLAAVRELTTEPHDFRTLVFDTLDWMEPLVWAAVCARAGVAGIEDVGGGYGKGYQAALDEWRVLLAAIERLRVAKKMHVIFLAHTSIKAFKDPAGPDYDRYEMKLNAKAGGLIKEWCDAVLFANYETFTHKDEKTKRIKGISTGARVLHTERTASWDGKNRYGLPESLPLSWADFEAAATKGQPAEPVDLREEIQRKAAELGEEMQKKTLASLERVGSDALKLSQLNSWVNAKLAEKAAKEGA